MPGTSKTLLDMIVLAQSDGVITAELITGCLLECPSDVGLH